MIDNLLPSPAWQDEQMAAYLAACTSNDEAGQKEIMATIVRAFEPYLNYLAKSWSARINRSRMLDPEDLLSIARMALVKAMNRWSPKYKKELSRLASRYIWGEIHSAVSKAAHGAVTVPQRAMRIAQRYKRIKEDEGLESAESYLDSVRSFASTKKLVRALANEGVCTLYLWQPIGDNGDLPLEATIADSDGAKTDVDNQVRETLRLVMHNLSPREQFVLYMLCPSVTDLPIGFSVRDKVGDPIPVPANQDLSGGARHRTIAKLMKVTPQRVSQIVQLVKAKIERYHIEPTSSPPPARSSPPGTPASPTPRRYSPPC